MTDTLAERFWKYVQKTPTCWLWTGCKLKSGYGQIYSHKLGPRRFKTRTAHTVSWELHHKQAIPKGMCVCHRCDNPSCVRPAHLFLGTIRDNAHDMFQKGRAKPFGNREGCTLITPDIVKAIKPLKGSISAIDVAKKYKISRGTVYNIWLNDSHYNRLLSI